MDQRIFLKVKTYIEKYHMIAPNDTIAAGVSGGADSVCLLLILCELMKELDFRLIVVHVNHGIREEAGEDASYVERLCTERGIPFFLVEEDVCAYAKREHLSEEEAGRKVRYEAFEKALAEYAEDNAKIAVAHNANDRAETMLFHLFRGTGLAGASGIKPVREHIIRPILCLSREEIEQYLQEKQMAFCIDRTNLEDTYTRNRIRNHIIPYAEKEICHGAVSHMCEAADMLLEAEDYIRSQREQAYGRCLAEKQKNHVILDISRLREEEDFIRKQLILKGLEELTKGRKDITAVHIREIEKLLYKQGSKQLSLPYGLQVRKEYDRLIMENREKRETTVKAVPLPEIPAAVPGAVEVPELGIFEFSLLSGKEASVFPEKTYTKWFDYDKITKSLLFRVRETGDYLTINGSMSKKSLKEYMIGEKIPKNKRGSMYILADGSHIVWVPGHRISEYYKVGEHTKNILKVQLRGGL